MMEEFQANLYNSDFLLELPVRKLKWYERFLKD
jgi:hypothetical protein